MRGKVAEVPLIFSNTRKLNAENREKVMDACRERSGYEIVTQGEKDRMN